MTRIVALLLALGGGLSAYRLLAGASQHIKDWEPDRIVAAAWSGAFAVVAATALRLWGLRGRGGREEREPWPWKQTVAVEGLLGAVLSAAVLVTLVAAVDAGRQNYWEAVHFASLVWAGFVSAAAAVALMSTAGRRGDAGASALSVFAWLPLVVWVLLWLLTWFGPLQDLATWLARVWYTSTHG